MIIVSSKEGQLCNRLFHFSSFIVNAIEFKYKLVYPCFDEYEQFFVAPSANNFQGYPISVNILRGGAFNNLIVKYLNKLKNRLPFGIVYHDIKSYDERGQMFHMNDPAFQQLVHAKTVVAHGWLYRDEDNLRKHKAIIRQLFAPVPQYQIKADTAVNNLRADADYVIGVHIRRGDYKEFLDGKFFYEDLVYVKRMREVAALMEAQGKTYKFLICSNEKLDMAHFDGLPVSFEPRHFITDLYALAQCDYIMGPPSTYSLWASYYADVPLYTIEDKDRVISALNNFRLLY